MRIYSLIIIAFLFGSLTAATQGQDQKKHYSCWSGASYTDPIWDKGYKPNPGEINRANADCQAELKSYLMMLSQAEQRTQDEQDKNLKVLPANKADVAKVANCARKFCAAGMKSDSTGNPYFDYNGMRYNIGAGDNLVIWVRPVGTTAKTDRKEFFDLDSDGTIDEGSEGSVKKYFKSWGPKHFGMEWKGYYQKGYNQALTSILEYIAANPKH